VIAALAAAAVITYWVEPCTQEQFACDKRDADLAVWALDAWSRASGGSLRFQSAAEDQAQIRFRWATARDGLYGEAVPITVNGRRGAEIHLRTDLRHLGKDFADIGRAHALFRETIVYLTCLHESGHALGLPHTDQFDDIMYSFQHGGDIREYFLRYQRRLKSREDIRHNSGMSPADERKLRAIFAPAAVK
jgi:hypothetical protein